MCRSRTDSPSASLRMTCIALLMMLCSHSSFSQKDPCVEEVRALYKKVTNAGSAQKNNDKIFHLDYTVKTTFTDSTEREPVKSHIVMWTNGTLMEVQSDEMQVYQDAGEAFVVLPEQKMIMRGDAGKFKSGASNRTTFIQDTAFALGKVTKCSDVKGKPGAKTLTLEFSGNGKTLLNLARITFTYNTVTGYFEHIRLDYANGKTGYGEDIAYVEYAFHKVSFNDSNKRLDVSVSRSFMSGKSSLNEKYKGYTLVDNRKKMNKQN